MSIEYSTALRLFVEECRQIASLTRIVFFVYVFDATLCLQGAWLLADYYPSRNGEHVAYMINRLKPPMGTVPRSSEPNTCTGLIADSHGDASALSKAIDVLGQRNASELIHLGDFFDSVNRGNLYEVWSLLHKNQVLAVKGNNDYQVEKMLGDDYGLEFQKHKEICLAFLKKIPIFFVSGDTCFSHSMPCNTIRAFYEPIDNGTTEKAIEVFEKTSYRVLFCGHSHNPVFFRYRGGNVTRERTAPGQRINTGSRERFIFIVGAAENGECGLYDMKRSFYERIVF